MTLLKCFALCEVWVSWSSNIFSGACEKLCSYRHSLNMKKWRTDPCIITRTDSAVALKLFPYVSSAQSFDQLCCPWSNATLHVLTLYRYVTWDVYRAGTSIHCGLIEGLTNSEGDMGGTDTGGCLDGQTLSLLGDFHCRARGRRHCNLPQENIHTCSHTNRTNVVWNHSCD